MLQHALNRGIITTLALFFALAAFLASGGFVQISLADEEADQLEAQVKSSADAYNDAILRQEELTAEIAELDARIAELEAKLPAQRERSDESIRALYKYEYDSSSVLMMLLESKSVTDMLAIVDSYNWIIEYNTSEIQRAIQMESDLRNARQQLETDKADVDKAAQDALTSLQEAREARERVAARAAAAQAAEQQANQNIINSSSATAEEKEAANAANSSASSASSSNVGWSSDKSQFVNEWAPRINAYLSGSPMSGTGVAYAAAAWDNGVDPRWAPQSRMSKAARVPSAIALIMRGAMAAIASARGKRASTGSSPRWEVRCTAVTSRARPLPHTVPRIPITGTTAAPPKWP